MDRRQRENFDLLLEILNITIPSLEQMRKWFSDGSVRKFYIQITFKLNKYCRKLITMVIIMKTALHS